MPNVSIQSFRLCQHPPREGQGEFSTLLGSFDFRMAGLSIRGANLRQREDGCVVVGLPIFTERAGNRRMVVIEDDALHDAIAEAASKAFAGLGGNMPHGKARFAGVFKPTRLPSASI